MAHAVSVTEEGGTPIPITTTNWILTNYTPVEAEAVEMSDSADAANTDLIGEVLYKRPTETIELYCYAASKTALQDAFRAVQTLMRMAQQRQRRGVGNRIFFQLKLDGEASTWQSEIMSGRLEISNDALALWPNVGFNVRLFITRRAYFEGTTDIAVSTTSSGHGATTSGSLITNTVDLNYVGIAAAQITGVLPTPLKVQVSHEGIDSSYSKIHVLNNASVSPTTYDAWFQSTETTVGDGSLNSTNPTANNVIRRWEIPDATLNLLQGVYVRALLALSVMPTGMQFRGFVETESVGDFYTRYRGSLIDGATNVVDLGLFPLPPGAAGSGYTQVNFGVGVRYSGALVATIHHLLLVPTDGERRLQTQQFVMQDDDRFVDDPYSGSFWIDDSSSGKNLALGAGQGGPLWVYPNVDNRLYILSSSNFSYVPARTNKVWAWYRPRRLTI